MGADDAGRGARLLPSAPVSTDRPLISVVSPVYNEQLVIEAFLGRLSDVVATIEGCEFEFVMVDDGSSDRSVEVLTKLAATDDRLRVIGLSRNFGHQLAITAGLDHARGDAVVVIDSDLQDPPEVIPDMIDRWRHGFDVVYGVRNRREGESRFKRGTAAAFYRVIDRLADVDLPRDAGDFRLLDRAVVDVVKDMREENRYMRGMVAWTGFSQCAVPYDRAPRAAGDSKYTLRKMVRLAVDGVTSFSDRPLRMATQLGFLVTLGALTWGVIIVLTNLFDPGATIHGWSSLMVTVLFLGGVQLVSIGLLGEYLGRTYREAKRRPLYIVRSDTAKPRPDRRVQT